MVEFNDRRPQPYFPHRGSPEKRAQPVQGKLFSDPKPVDSARYQRGYTPERMRGVRDLEARGKLNIKGVGTTPATPAKVRENLARSATPLSEMSGLDIRVNAKAYPGSSRAGSYETLGPGEGEINMYPHRSGETPRQKKEYTARYLIHELGHHRSALLGNPSAEYRLPKQVGAEEAFADDNMMERFRPDPRNTRRGDVTPKFPELAYEQPGVFGKSSSARLAHKTYLATRRTPIQKDAEQADIDRQVRDSVIRPGLFHRNGEPTDAANPNISPQQFARKYHQS